MRGCVQVRGHVGCVRRPHFDDVRISARDRGIFKRRRIFGWGHSERIQEGDAPLGTPAATNPGALGIQARVGTDSLLTCKLFILFVARPLG